MDKILAIQNQVNAFCAALGNAIEDFHTASRESLPLNHPSEASIAFVSRDSFPALSRELRELEEQLGQHSKQKHLAQVCIDAQMALMGVRRQLSSVQRVNIGAFSFRGTYTRLKSEAEQGTISEHENEELVALTHTLSNMKETCVSIAQKLEVIKNSSELHVLKEKTDELAVHAKTLI